MENSYFFLSYSRCAELKFSNCPNVLVLSFEFTILVYHTNLISWVKYIRTLWEDFSTILPQCTSTNSFDRHTPIQIQKDQIIIRAVFQSQKCLFLYPNRCRWHQQPSIDGVLRNARFHTEAVFEVVIQRGSGRRRSLYDILKTSVCLWKQHWLFPWTCGQIPSRTYEG